MKNLSMVIVNLPQGYQKFDGDLIGIKGIPYPIYVIFYNPSNMKTISFYYDSSVQHTTQEPIYSYAVANYCTVVDELLILEYYIELTKSSIETVAKRRKERCYLEDSIIKDLME